MFLWKNRKNKKTKKHFSSNQLLFIPSRIINQARIYGDDGGDDDAYNDGDDDTYDDGDDNGGDDDDDDGNDDDDVDYLSDHKQDEWMNFWET